MSDRLSMRDQVEAGGFAQALSICDSTGEFLRYEVGMDVWTEGRATKFTVYMTRENAAVLCKYLREAIAEVDEAQER